MDWIHTLLDNSSTPMLTAFALGLLTAISPCPLATNIAAIGFIGKNIENRQRIFFNGFLYTLGRIIAYSVLGIILITILNEGASVFGLQKVIGKWSELLLGPILIIIGLFMLLGHKLNLSKLNIGENSENFARKGGSGALLIGILFAFAFCPTSGVFYFGMLIPMSVSVNNGWILPSVFAIATAIPVLIVAWVLAFSAEKIGKLYGRIHNIQKWLTISTGLLFIVIGLYYCMTIYL